MSIGDGASWKDDWTESHEGCRRRYCDILSLENPDMLFFLERSNKQQKRYAEKCKAHGKPMWVYGKKREDTSCQVLTFA